MSDPCDDRVATRPGNRSTRRSFLKAVLVTGIAPRFVPSRVLGASGHVPPSEKISVGVIGVGAQGRGDMGNFLAQDDVRVTAICDIEAAVRSDTLCQLALIAVKRGRRLAWDPGAECFPGDESANGMLEPRAMRGPWNLPFGTGGAGC